MGRRQEAAQARRRRRRRARLRRQPRAHAHDARADGRDRARQHRSRRPTRRSCGSACRWRRRSSCRWSARASRTTCSRRCTTRIPTASRSRRRSPRSRRDDDSSRSPTSRERVERDPADARSRRWPTRSRTCSTRASWPRPPTSTRACSSAPASRSSSGGITPHLDQQHGHLCRPRRRSGRPLSLPAPRIRLCFVCALVLGGSNRAAQPLRNQQRTVGAATMATTTDHLKEAPVASDELVAAAHCAPPTGRARRSSGPTRTPQEALAPGTARRRALDDAIEEMAAGATRRARPGRCATRSCSGSSACSRGAARRSRPGTELRRHQVDALAGMLTELIHASQKENGNGNGNGAAHDEAPERLDEDEAGRRARARRGRTPEAEPRSTRARTRARYAGSASVTRRRRGRRSPPPASSRRRARWAS